MAVDELARLRAIEQAAESYIASRRAIWQHKQAEPDGYCVLATVWMQTNDLLEQASEDALVALTQAIGVSG